MPIYIPSAMYTSSSSSKSLSTSDRDSLLSFQKSSNFSSLLSGGRQREKGKETKSAPGHQHCLDGERKHFSESVLGTSPVPSKWLFLVEHLVNMLAYFLLGLGPGHAAVLQDLSCARLLCRHHRTESGGRAEVLAVGS